MESKRSQWVQARARCESRRSDGEPCLSLQRVGSTFCYGHDPATAIEREATKVAAVAARERKAVRRQEALRQPAGY
jgi:hypothetical protein